MFFTIIILAYLLPNIYLFLQIGHRFINKGYRFSYALIYILIALIYPLSNLFLRGIPGPFPSFMGMIANYLLPFYLYLFLFVLVFDIFLLVNWLIKIVPAEKMKSTHFKKTGLSVILLLSMGVVIAGIINFNTIRVSDYQIDISRKSAKIDHLKIAFVADFHLSSGTDVHFVERFAEKIAEIKPDLMIFGGDIVEGNRGNGSLGQFEKIFSGIRLWGPPVRTAGKSEIMVIEVNFR